MKLGEIDRELLAALGPEPRHVDALVGTGPFDAPEPLHERLSELADNGLVEDLGAGRYRRTESGRRLLSIGTSARDDAVDTTPAVEGTIAELDLAPDAAAAVRSVYAFLRYWGFATTDEIVDAIYPERPAGDGSPDVWWESIVRPALSALPDVDGPPDGATLPAWRYAGRAEVTTPEADGFLPAERRGHRLYGSVKHAIESLELSADERDAVRAAFAVLRRQKAAERATIVDAAFAAHPAGYDAPGAWWTELVTGALAELPGVHRFDGDRWRYDLPPTG